MPELKTRYACVSLDVEIFDLEQLRLAAHAKALETMPEHVWANMRTGHSNPAKADLIMLLDPGSIDNAGFSIVDSNAELAD